MAETNARQAIRPEDLQLLPITCEATIPEAYIDLMGHMNVMWYTHLFSEATLAFFSSFGMGIEYWKSRHAGTFALEAHIRYLAEIEVGTRIRVFTRALERSARRVHYMHFLVNEQTGALSTLGEFVSAHIDMETRRTSPLPDELATRLDRMCRDHQRLAWAAPVCGSVRLQQRR